jgi:ABC-2 type transport system permease protein
MRSLLLIVRREFAAYFATPLAAVFLAVFVAVSSGMTFFVSSFFERAQADLSTFFTWQPWLFLVLMPAVGMRLWAEERRLGNSCSANGLRLSPLPVSRLC